MNKVAQLNKTKKRNTDYLGVVYNPISRPYTNYPQKLVRHLCNRFGLKPGKKFLEIGCGRGEHLSLFEKQGLDVVGVDMSPTAPKLSPTLKVYTSNVEDAGLPFEDDTFDIVYSKSVIEHFKNPEKYMSEAIRVLKPGGLFLILVPDWESQYLTFFDDYTHRSPFTKVGLLDMCKIFGLEDVEVSIFRQLPSTWRFPVLNYFCAAISPFISVRTKISYLRWSRELMLIGTAKKPLNK